MQLPVIAVDWTWCVFIPGEKNTGKKFEVALALLFSLKANSSAHT